LLLACCFGALQRGEAFATFASTPPCADSPASEVRAAAALHGLNIPDCGVAVRSGLCTHVQAKSLCCATCNAQLEGCMDVSPEQVQAAAAAINAGAAAMHTSVGADVLSCDDVLTHGYCQWPEARASCCATCSSGLFVRAESAGGEDCTEKSASKGECLPSHPCDAVSPDDKCGANGGTVSCVACAANIYRSGNMMCVHESVTAIPANALHHCRMDLVWVHMPSVTVIPAHVTSQMGTHLRSVYAPSATEIGESAFRGAAQLESVYLPNAVTIGRSAFWPSTVWKDQCELKSLALPSATTIGDYAFWGCHELTKVYLPKAVTIGEHAFENTYRVTDVVLPSATTIGRDAFAMTWRIVPALTTVHLPSVTHVGSWAFHRQTSLTRVELPPPSIFPSRGCCAFTMELATTRCRDTAVGPGRPCSHRFDPVSVAAISATATTCDESCGTCCR